MARGEGYGVASVPGTEEGREEDAVGHSPLTESLGCTELRVDAYQLESGAPMGEATDRERVVVPLGLGSAVSLDDAVDVSPRVVGRVPPGATCPVHEKRTITVVVVSAPAPTAEGGSDPTAIDLDAVEYAVPPTSDVATAHLTARLGCTGMKANARILEPGQAVPTHTEGTQEELFVPIDGPASMRIDGEAVATPPGTLVRVAPATPRSAINDGDTDALWLMFGAPPTGGPTEWDPGATILE